MSDTTISRALPEEDLPPIEAGSGRLRTWWWRELRPLLMRIHFYAGLFIGPFLLVAAVTGLLYTITPQLERAVHRDQLQVVEPPGATPLPLSAQVSAALADPPGGAVTEIRPPRTGNGTTRVIFNDPAVGEDWTRTVFVDPYTGRRLGTLTTFGEWLPVRAWFDDLHRNLHLGAAGRHYSELAASWLWVLALSGLGLWVARRRRTRRIRRTLAPELRGGGRGRLRSWHASVGLWAVVGLLFLSATGLTWSRFAGEHVDQLRTALSWSTPTVDTAIPATAAAPADGISASARTGVATADVAATAEKVWTAARTHGLSDPVKIVPGDAGEAWVVQQVQRSWPEKQDSVAVDPVSGTVLAELRFADWPLMAKLARWGVDAHMGLLFGVASQTALAMLALGLLSMIVWGYRMWWLRRPTRGLPRAPGGPATSFSALLVLGALAVGVGLFLPLLGGSLLVFLLIDALRSQIRDRAVTKGDEADLG